jgi:hypothetical protein
MTGQPRNSGTKSWETKEATMNHPINNKWEWMTKESFGSHVPILIECLCLAPAGPVLEIGMGEYSTLVLHQFRHLRKITSIDNDINYVNTFLHLQEAEQHRIMHVDNYETFPLEDTHWAVALVDHTVEGRMRELKRLWKHCDLAVVHDCTGAADVLEQLRGTWKHYWGSSRFATAVFTDIPNVVERIGSFDELGEGPSFVYGYGLQ